MGHDPVRRARRLLIEALETPEQRKQRAQREEAKKARRWRRVLADIGHTPESFEEAGREFDRKFGGERE
jgi:hypothetical protein